jgi:hypothetical protein
MVWVQMASSHLGTVLPTVSLGTGGRQQRPGYASGSSRGRNHPLVRRSLHEQHRRVTAGVVENGRSARTSVAGGSATELTQAGFMQKIILMSVIYATAIIPLLAARDTSARRGLRRAIAWLLAFNVIYLLAVVFLYPHFS